MIRGPKSIPDVFESAVIYSRGGLSVVCDRFLEGRLWEASWPASTHGSIVAELIGMIPSAALDMGDGWITDDDSGRTYAGFWEAAA
ncbi:hypothetical protein ACQEVF_22190 [Nonomuraea polychroma]|uniref:hypothetical protein n=1 Tax=Nonomuraea polychroma TaxID=46176 RepID=UPI003D8D73D0